MYNEIKQTTKKTFEKPEQAVIVVILVVVVKNLPLNQFYGEVFMVSSHRQKKHSASPDWLPGDRLKSWPHMLWCSGYLKGPCAAVILDVSGVSPAVRAQPEGKQWWHTAPQTLKGHYTEAVQRTRELTYGSVYPHTAGMTVFSWSTLQLHWNSAMKKVKDQQEETVAPFPLTQTTEQYLAHSLQTTYILRCC